MSVTTATTKRLVGYVPFKPVSWITSFFWKSPQVWQGSKGIAQKAHFRPDQFEPEWRKMDDE